MQPFRWGILGTGSIAAKFAIGLQALDNVELAAVGSRSAESARDFGKRFGATRRHASYEALAADPEVDAIYVATPHPFHKENTLLCLQAGKPVICEKPFSINAAEAEAMVAASRDHRVFLMEAMWTRFLPHIIALRQRIADGAIGEPRMLTASFCFRTDLNPRGRLFDPALGGGALLDVGIYVVALASMIFGQPDRVSGQAHVGITGVDEQCALAFGYPSGQLASLTAAVRTSTPSEALLAGTDGFIRIHPPFWGPSSFTIVRPGRDDEYVAPQYTGNGYNYEAAEVMRCVRAGLIESPTVTHDETISMMRTLDTLRAQWGLRYPSEL